MDKWPLVVQARSGVHEQVSRILLSGATNSALESSAIRRSTREQVRDLLLDRICFDDDLRSGKRATVHSSFGVAVREFLARLLPYSAGLLPAGCSVETQPPGRRLTLSQFAQFRHVADLERLSVEEASIRSSVAMGLAQDPNVLMLRAPLHDNEINDKAILVELTLARRSWLRARHQPKPLLHAALWCRSSMSREVGGAIRASARSLSRLRRGRAPHIAAVTCEVLPSRMTDLALSPGELDCCYHCALPELRSALSTLDADEELALLDVMVQTQRLKDVSDLFLDLAL